MGGGGVSVSLGATLAGDAATAAAALALLVCLGVPGQTSHLNGIEPALLHESSSIAAIFSFCNEILSLQTFSRPISLPLPRHAPEFIEVVGGDDSGVIPGGDGLVRDSGKLSVLFLVCMR